MIVKILIIKEVDILLEIIMVIIITIINNRMMNIQMNNITQIQLHNRFFPNQRTRNTKKMVKELMIKHLDLLNNKINQVITLG